MRIFLNRILLTILFLQTTILSLSQLTKLDSIFADYESELKYACGGPIVKYVDFEKKKIAQDKKYLQLASKFLLQKKTLKEFKKTIWKEKNSHFIKEYALENNKVYEVSFNGNYIKGEMIYSFNNEKLISSGIRMDNSYLRYCWDKTGPDVSLIDMELVRNVILPIIPNHLISEIMEDMVAGDYRRLFRRIVGQESKDVKQ